MGFRHGVMIDVETLGVSYDSIIVSLAAVKFSVSNGILSEFSMNVDPSDAKRYGLKTDKNTIAWWKTQPKEVIAAWNKDQKPLKEVIEAFCDWYGPKSHPTWTKGGVCFDYPILQSSFDAVGIRTPYHFRDCLDCRTLFNFFGVKDWQNKKEGVVAHCALDDCKHQVYNLVPLIEIVQED